MGSPFDDVDIDALRRRRTVKWSLHGPDVLAAWVAEMDFDVAPPVRTAVQEAVEREDFGYVAADLTELTSACAGFLADRYGWEVEPPRIFPVADVMAGVAGVLDTMLAPGTPIVAPTPIYPPFFEVIGLHGHPIVEVPMADDGARRTLDLDGIDAALAAGAGLVVLLSPSNPTGRVFTLDELGALAAVVERHGARVLADEVHAPLVYPGHRHVPYAGISRATADHTITVTSASKAWNIPGLPCAQVITSNHADAKHWRELPVLQVPGPVPIGVAASTAAYRDGGPWLRDVVAYLDGNRAHLGTLFADHVPGVDYRPPEGTYLAWLDCRALGLDDPAGFFLHDAKVALNDGPPFGAGYGQCVRFNFATSRAILEQIVGRMGAALRAR